MPEGNVFCLTNSVHRPGGCNRRDVASGLKFHNQSISIAQISKISPIAVWVAASKGSVSGCAGILSGYNPFLNNKF
jgi:hypothetical protein